MTPTIDALLLGALRAIPLALCLPLPGLFARLALGIVLATVGVAATETPLSALVSGVSAGLLIGAPIWAARWAGLIIGRVSASPALDALYTTLAWIVFFAAGGARLLFVAVSSPLPVAGTHFVSLAAQLALPALLAIAIVEVLGALAERVEGAAALPLDAHRVARATRPLLATLLLLSGLASFAHVVAVYHAGLR